MFACFTKAEAQQDKTEVILCNFKVVLRGSDLFF